MTDTMTGLCPAPTVDRTRRVPHPVEGWPPTLYRERVWTAERDALWVVLATEIAANPGLSVTNNVERIWTDSQTLWGPSAIVVEHYDHGSYRGGRALPESFDIIEVNAGGVWWTHLHPRFFAVLVGWERSSR